LQVLDDGRLTDGHGRTVDFRNTVIIMTSNLGSNLIQEMAGVGNYDRMKTAVMEVVNGHFRPEFINRVDDMVVFHPLDDEQLAEIARIQVGFLTERLAGRDIKLEVSNDTVAALAKAGFDPAYGARPLKRAIRRRLENPLASEILGGRYQPGDSIRVETKGDDIVFMPQVELLSQAA
jgi:ATP-dependent Clp protease ATP-binding subunit ClpB